MICMLRLAVFCSLAALAYAQSPGKADAGGMPAPTAELERGRTVYVLSSCHFCHGIDLTGAAMGAANLMTSRLVGRDENGNMIGPIVKAGLPNLQTAMPQYPDYSNQQITDLAAYIHYLRQLGCYKQLSAISLDIPGDAAAGQSFFAGSGKCTACHTTADMQASAKKHSRAALRSKLLRPDGDAASAGSKSHLKLLEQYSDDDVRNLLAYLQNLK